MECSSPALPCVLTSSRVDEAAALNLHTHTDGGGEGYISSWAYTQTGEGYISSWAYTQTEEGYISSWAYTQS